MMGAPGIAAMIQRSAAWTLLPKSQSSPDGANAKIDLAKTYSNKFVEQPTH
jgi:hypothetical protein